jgi:hypothetical protein
MSPKLISCRVMIEEIKGFLPECVATEVFEISLHTHPEQLRKALQEAINASDGVYDPIYLGYGLCGKAIVGLVAKKSRLVVPKTDDCIAIFLGSRQARVDQLNTAPGTYFLTQGWIGGGAGSLFSDYDRMAEKYGPEKAEKFVGKLLRNYNRLAYIRLPNTTTLESDRQYARNTAARFHMEYDEIDGTPRLLQRMVEQDWDEDFVVVEPGQPITIEQFLNSSGNGSR